MRIALALGFLVVGFPPAVASDGLGCLPWEECPIAAWFESKAECSASTDRCVLDVSGVATATGWLEPVVMSCQLDGPDGSRASNEAIGAGRAQCRARLRLEVSIAPGQCTWIPGFRFGAKVTGLLTGGSAERILAADLRACNKANAVPDGLDR
ncbi:MAG TPA: hypothetical protein VM681_03785 [Candidatus Thermoplasmatota archaeon]|nr:hypothetical protein [Candidatus Thermoplasmatota archaeon]